MNKPRLADRFPADLPLPSPLRIGLGIVVAMATVICAFGAAGAIVWPSQTAPLLDPMLGMVCLCLCAWQLSACGRMIFGRCAMHRTFGATLMKWLGAAFLLLPLACLFSEFHQANPIVPAVQFVAATCVFLRLRFLAARALCRHDSKSLSR